MNAPQSNPLIATHAAHIGGFPRIGAQRELKFALESFWRGESDADALHETGRAIRSANWAHQRTAGLDWVTVGDFAWYDHVFQTLALVGGLPTRFACRASELSLEAGFGFARGTATQPAMEMTKWFDTNYHYLVPEYTPDLAFADTLAACGGWLFDDVAEAQALGLPVKVTLLGPVSLLRLGKEKRGLADRLTLLPQLLQAYAVVLAELKARGVALVQIDEPVLALDLEPCWIEAFEPAYAQLAQVAPPLLLATYFGSVAEHAALLGRLPVAGVHVDAVRAPEQLQPVASVLPAGRVLSVGIVDGRNVWCNDLSKSLQQLEALRATHPGPLWVAPSCSLLHVPVDLTGEAALDNELRQWLAFAVQKLDEVALLARGLREGRPVIQHALDASDLAVRTRQASVRVHNPTVRRRVTELGDRVPARASLYETRAVSQREAFALPLLPTTTIGSFPQTASIRATRSAFKQGRVGQLEYLEAMRGHIADAVRRQEALGLDVLVHGEAERNDMVEYFGELLWGYAFTANGWVQSYGSRCVKPPLLYGDVALPEPMTVSWSRYAQSLTSRPMKGMLTGPVTMLQWAFVRDDQPRKTTALQIALALRDEVLALEAAGIRMIQIDEPALREGLPLRRADWETYLAWAVRAFRVSCADVADATQIHTHMCYSEFHDILPAIAALDADVLSIETTRSEMELLSSFGEYSYPNEIGPGVYDIHSPRIPSVEEIEQLITAALGYLPAERLWVNPDCGLKTRQWDEVEPALKHLVEATKRVRARAQL